MVGKSSGTLCGVEPPSWEVMKEERRKGLRLDQNQTLVRPTGEASHNP